MNVPCSSGLGRNCWGRWWVPNANEFGFFSRLGCGKGRAWITPQCGWEERCAYSSQNVLPKLLIYMSAKWNRGNSSWSLQEKVLTHCQSSALKLCNLKCMVCLADPARLLVLEACVAGMGAGQLWPGERKGDTNLIFLCPSVRSGLCSSQSKGEDEDVVLHRDCVSVCVCMCRYLLGLFPKWPSLCAQVLVMELQVLQVQSCSNADKNPGNNWLQRGSVRGWVPTPPLQRRVRIRRSVFSQTVNHPCRAKNSPLTESMMQFVTFMFCPHVLSVLTKVEGAPLWCREVMPDEMQNCIRIPSTIQTQPFHHPCGFFFAFQDIMMQ